MTDGCCSLWPAPQGIQTGTSNHGRSQAPPRSLAWATYIQAPLLRSLSPKTPVHSLLRTQSPHCPQQLALPISAWKVVVSSQSLPPCLCTPSVPPLCHSSFWVLMPHPAGTRGLQGPVGWGLAPSRAAHTLHQRVSWLPGLILGARGTVEHTVALFKSSCCCGFILLGCVRAA